MFLIQYKTKTDKEKIAMYTYKQPPNGVVAQTGLEPVRLLGNRF